MTTENALQRFKNAVGILVDEKGGIKERLMVAYISQLSKFDPAQELPKDLAIRFDGIRLTLAIEEGMGDQGTVSKGLEKISDDEASGMARQIFEIFLVLHDSAKK